MSEKDRLETGKEEEEDFVQERRRGKTRTGRAYREETEDPYFVTVEALKKTHHRIFQQRASLSYTSVRYNVPFLIRKTIEEEKIFFFGSFSLSRL